MEVSSLQFINFTFHAVWLHILQLFCSIYGCASATAQKWYDRGLRTLDDVQQCQNLELSEVQKIGNNLHITTCVCTHTDTDTHTYTHVHIHTYTHIHTCTDSCLIQYEPLGFLLTVYINALDKRSNYNQIWTDFW